MITLLVGSNRPGSNTRLVARQLEGIYTEMKQPVRLLDLAQLPPEIFTPSAYSEKPASFAPFADAVLTSSGLHVVTPEYNGSMLRAAAGVLHGVGGGAMGRTARSGAAPANLWLPERAHLS